MISIKLVGRKSFRDYDVYGFGNILRAVVPYGIKVGDLFNIYRKGGRKNGCKWTGTLKGSLLEFIHTEKSELIDSINFKLLKKQKAELVRLQFYPEKYNLNKKQVNAITGITNLLDAIQEAAQ